MITMRELLGNIKRVKDIMDESTILDEDKGFLVISDLLRTFPKDIRIKIINELIHWQLDNDTEITSIIKQQVAKNTEDIEGLTNQVQRLEERLNENGQRQRQISYRARKNRRVSRWFR